MAREDIQINTVAPQANTVAPADVYSRPYWDRQAGSGFMELAKSLGILGDTIAHKQKENARGQGEADYAHYGALEAEFGDPSAKNASLITGTKDSILNLFSKGTGSATVRNKVEEVQGDTAASNDFFAEGGYGSRLMPFAHDQAALDAEMKKIRAEAFSKAGGRRAYGDKYIEQLDTYLNGFKGESFKQRQSDYKFKEEQSIAKTAIGAGTPDPQSTTNLHDHVNGASDSLISYLTKDKPSSYITDLQPEFSSRISKMIEAAPPEIRARIKIDSGARTPARQAELIADKLGGADRAAFSKMVKQYGPEKGGAMWASTFPQAAKARGIGHSIALPGRSLHQHGFAIDFFRDPVAEAWMHKNAGNFGLYYPMGHEPWHIEQIGARGRSGPRAIPGEGAVERTMGPLQPSVPNNGYRGWDNSPNFFDNYYKTMMSVENTTGNPGATNGQTTAMGNAQFVAATWIEQYGKKFGDTGESDDEILAKRSDPALSKELGIQYAKENAKALEALAIPVNTTTLLMAHQMGAKGSAAVLQAVKSDQSTPLADVLSDEAMAKNPQWQGMTVGQAYAAAASKTGEFTNPVGGAKERTETAYHEGIATSTLGPEAFNKTFAESIINQATATQNTGMLDSMPDVIMSQPAYAEKVRVARESIISNKRETATRAVAAQDAQNKATNEALLGQAAGLIIDNPFAEMPPDFMKMVAAQPGGGFETLTKLRAMQASMQNPTPASIRADVLARDEAAQVLEAYSSGTATEAQARAAALKINNPEMLKSALSEVTKYKFVPTTVSSPIVKDYTKMFLQANYEFVEGTVIPTNDAVKAEQASRWFNIRLSAKLASLGHQASEQELFGDGIQPGILGQVKSEVLEMLPPATLQGLADTTGQKAGQADPPPPTPAAPVVTPQGTMTPEEALLFNKYAPSRKNVPQR